MWTNTRVLLERSRQVQCGTEVRKRRAGGWENKQQRKIMSGSRSRGKQIRGKGINRLTILGCSFETSLFATLAPVPAALAEPADLLPAPVPLSAAPTPIPAQVRMQELTSLPDQCTTLSYLFAPFPSFLDPRTCIVLARLLPLVPSGKVMYRFPS